MIRNQPVTFSFWADCQESIVSEEFEQRPHAIRVSSQEDFSVGSVQQNESEDTVQEGRHLLDAEAIIQMEQNLTVHFGLVIEIKLLLQLGEKWRNIVVILGFFT